MKLTMETTSVKILDPATIPATPAKSAPSAANGGNAHVPPATPSSGSSSSTSSKPAGSGELGLHVLIKALAVVSFGWCYLALLSVLSKHHILSLQVFLSQVV